jgi:hypothetical protein
VRFATATTDEDEDSRRRCPDIEIDFAFSDTHSHSSLCLFAAFSSARVTPWSPKTVTPCSSTLPVDHFQLSLDLPCSIGLVLGLYPALIRSASPTCFFFSVACGGSFSFEGVLDLEDLEDLEEAEELLLLLSLSLLPPRAARGSKFFSLFFLFFDHTLHHTIFPRITALYPSPSARL